MPSLASVVLSMTEAVGVYVGVVNAGHLRAALLRGPRDRWLPRHRRANSVGRRRTKNERGAESKIDGLASFQRRPPPRPDKRAPPKLITHIRSTRRNSRCERRKLCDGSGQVILALPHSDHWHRDRIPNHGDHKNHF